MAHRKHFAVVALAAALLLAGCGGGGGEVSAGTVEAVSFSDQPLDKDAPSAPTATVNGSTVKVSGEFRASGTRECVAPFAELTAEDPLTMALDLQPLETEECNSDQSTAVWGYNTTINMNESVPSELTVEHPDSDFGPWTISLSESS